VGSGAALATALLPRAIAAAVDGPHGASSAAWPMPPATARIPVTVGRFGYSRSDEYAWLRPKDWPAVLRDPAALEAPIRAHLDAENAYADAMLAPTRPLQAQLRARIEALDALRPGEDAAAAATTIEGAVPGQLVPLPGDRHVVWLR